MGKNKGDYDRTMVKSLDMIPYGEMPKWNQIARFLFDKKIVTQAWYLKNG